MLLAVVLPGTLSWAINWHPSVRHVFGWYGNTLLSQLILERSCVVVFVLFWFHRLGHYQIRLPLRREARQIVLIVAAAMTIHGALRWWLHTIEPNVVLLEYWISTLVLVLGGRRMIRGILHRRGLWRLPIVVVGSTPRVAVTTSLLKTHLQTDYEITGSVDPGEFAHLAERDYRQELARHGGAEGVIVVLDDTSKAMIEPLLRQNLLIGAVAAPATADHPRLEPAFRLDATAVMRVPRQRLADPLSRGLKRLIDILGVTVALALGLVLAPLWAGLVLIIKADGGPLWFRQYRVGRHGQLFECLKLRTMRVDAEQALHQELLSDAEKAREWQQDAKIREDPRITPIGRFLRRTSLDELPQIINVLRGEMSLVGPRPVVPDEMARYGCDAAYYLRVCPGITGLWQVSGRNNLDYPTRVRLDADYVGNWTLGRDIAILLRTVPALLTGRGAC